MGPTLKIHYFPSFKRKLSDELGGGGSAPPPPLPPPVSATNMYELHNATLDHHKNNFCFDDNTLSNGDSPLILALK